MYTYSKKKTIINYDVVVFTGGFFLCSIIDRKIVYNVHIDDRGVAPKLFLGVPDNIKNTAQAQ